MSVTIAANSIVVGATTQATATLADARGTVLSGFAVTWMSDNPAIASVTQSGLVTGLAAGGPVTITATSDGMSGTAQVTIIPVPVASISVSLANDSLVIGDSTLATAILRDAQGNVLTGREVSWTSANPAIASVAQSGRVTAIAVGGPIMITGKSEGISDSALVTVSPVRVATVTVTLAADTILVGGSTPATATVRDAKGNVLAGRTVVWHSANPAIASVTQNGVVTGVSAGGPILITAMSEGVSSGANVTVERIGIVTQIDAAWGSTCALTNANTGYCWGFNARGQLGDGTTLDRTSPVLITGPVRLRQIAIDAWHSCAVSVENRAYCWGDNTNGPLGVGDNVHRSTPTAVIGPDFKSITVGFEHSCALTPAGKPYCWGNGGWGVLGLGNQTFWNRPQAVSGNHTFTSITGGSQHVCAITEAGIAYCWGRNTEGALGDGKGGGGWNGGVNPDNTFRSYPDTVRGGLRFSRIVSGFVHTCGITLDGLAFCWGANHRGQLGDGTTLTRTSPVPVLGSHRFIDIAPGSDHTCALSHEGTVYCWGNNAFGQLGRGSRSTLEEVFGAAPVTNGKYTRIVAGAVHTCAIGMDQDTYCWGANQNGEIGNGQSGIGRYVLTPTRIVLPSVSVSKRQIRELTQPRR